MFEKIRSKVRDVLVKKTPEQERLEQEIEICEKELKRASFALEHFIRVVHNSSPANNEQLGSDLKRITENEDNLKAKLEDLKRKLEAEKSK